MTTPAPKVVSAHQANYLPYLGFFEKITRSKLFILVDDTQFVKRGPFGWIHRNKILSQGESIWLTIPVKTHDRYHQSIAEVEISEPANWQRKHLKSIEFAYRKAPFFNAFYPILEDIYTTKWNKLLEINRRLIEAILDHLDIHVEIQLASDLKIEGKSSDYVLELSQKTGASHYLSGLHGRDYLNQEDFQKAGLQLIFQEFNCLPYPQVSDTDFISHLSIIDAIFLTGADGTRKLLRDGARYDVPD